MIAMYLRMVINSKGQAALTFVKSKLGASTGSGSGTGTGTGGGSGSAGSVAEYVSST